MKAFKKRSSFQIKITKPIKGGAKRLQNKQVQSEEKSTRYGGGECSKISIQKIIAEEIMILHLWVNGNAIKGYVVAKDGLEWKPQ